MGARLPKRNLVAVWGMMCGMLFVLCAFQGVSWPADGVWYVERGGTRSVAIGEQWSFDWVCAALVLSGASVVAAGFSVWVYLLKRQITQRTDLLQREQAERRRIEDDLRGSERRFSELYDQAPVGYHQVDLEGRIVRVNRTELAMLGYTVDEMVGQYVWDFVIEREIAQQAVLSRLEGLTPDGRELELTWQRKDGSVLLGAVDDQVLKDECGRTSGLWATVRDITAQKQIAEEHLRLAAAVEQIAEAIIILNDVGLIQYVNPAFERITGYMRHDVLGAPPRMIESRVRDARFYRELWHTLAHGAAWRGRLAGEKKDESSYEAQVTISPIYDVSGQTMNYVISQRDVTQRILLEDQLRQAQRMEAMGQLAAGIAHDFNNHLTAINGYVDFLLMDLDKGDPRRADVQEIRKAAERSASLTRQLLTFSRKQVIQPVVMNLNDLVLDIEKMLRRLIGEHIELLTALDESLGQVRADPGQIEQVIMNLVVNARDAMPDGGKLIIETANVELDSAYVRQHTDTMAGAYVMLSVSDTGTGMDKDVLSHLFEPFFTTKRCGKGTGLGLATVYGIVKQSGGNIWPYSEPGQGTTFKIYLPRVDQPVASADQQSIEPDVLWGSETILVVEDEAAVRTLARRILQRRGYLVLEAMNAREALTFDQEYLGTIHLMITDVIIPGEMSGRELARRLSVSRPETKVIYMSGYTDNVIVHHGVLDPGVHFIQKPFSADALTRQVRRVLDDL